MIETNYQETTVEKEIDLDKVYQFPSEIEEIDYAGKKLVIYTQGVCWLVLENKDEYSVYKDLKSGITINEALEKYGEDLVANVVTQIEAKHFDNPVVQVPDERNIYIYLTNNCNERCRHCYMYAGDIEFDELDTIEWKSILSDLKSNGGTGVTFTGGEPTVYKEFKDLVSYAKALGLRVTVLSNGILWQDDEIEKYSAYLDEIQISIDGYDRASYFYVRQFDGFEKALSTALKFSDKGTRVSIAVTPLFDDIDKFIAEFEPLANKILFEYPSIFFKFNLELLEGRNVHADKTENNLYREKMRSLVERLYPNFYEETFPMNYPDGRVMSNCGFGEISLAANGDAYWCNRIHELRSNYNIRDIGFKRLFEISEQIKSKTNVENSAVCSKCAIKYICGGGCRMNYPDIQNVDEHKGTWMNVCDKNTKESFYKKMILSNDYFYTE